MSDAVLAMAAYLDGRLDPRDADDLARAIREDASVADAVAQIMMLDTHLRERLGIVSRGPRGAETTPAMGWTLRRWHVAASGAIAAALLVAGVLAARWLRPDGSTPRPAPSIASVVYAEGVRWEGEPVSIGQGVPGGELAIGEGELDIMLRSTATMSLSGATRVVMHDPMHVSLRSGRVRVVCPQAARGFTIDLASGVRVVDLGTDFELRTDASGRSRLYVHEGTVAARDAAGSDTELAAGDGVAFDADGRSIGIDDDPWLRSRTAMGALRRDAALAAMLDPEPGPGAEPVMHGASIVREGRDDAAIRFDGVDDEALLSDLAVDGPLTIMAWVRPERIDAEFSALVMSPGWGPGRVHVQLDGGRLKFNLFDGVELLADAPLPAGRWSHVSVTLDTSTRAVRAYVDGVVVGEAAVPVGIAPRMTAATVAAWRPEGDLGYTGSQRRFVGEIDDLAILSRSLTEHEIAEIVRSTRRVRATSDDLTTPPHEVLP